MYYKIKWKIVFILKDIKKFFRIQWGKLVAIGHKEIGFDGELGYLTNYVEIQLPIKINELNNKITNLQKQIDNLKNISK